MNDYFLRATTQKLISHRRYDWIQEEIFVTCFIDGLLLRLYSSSGTTTAWSLGCHLLSNRPAAYLAVKKRFQKYPIAVWLLQQKTIPSLYDCCAKLLDADILLLRKDLSLAFLTNIKPVLINVDCVFIIIKENLAKVVQRSVSWRPTQSVFPVLFTPNRLQRFSEHSDTNVFHILV